MYEIDENEAENVRLMFQMSLGEIGSHRIANHFNSRNVPTKFSGKFKDKGEIKRIDKYTKEVVKFKKKDVKWRGNVIADILKNPIYKGERIWNVYKDKISIVDGQKVKSKILVETITGKMPAIVSEKLWESVQKSFEKNKKEVVGKKAQYHYLINGLVFCERCRNKYWGKKRLKGNDNAYKCLSKKYLILKCDNRGLNLPKPETFVIQHLQKITFSTKVLNSLPSQQSLIEKYFELRIKKINKVEELSKAIKTLSNQLQLSSKIKEVMDKLASMQNKRQFLLDGIEILNKKIIEEESNNQNESVLKAVRNKIKKIVNFKTNFSEFKEAVFNLVNWISIEYVNRNPPAYYKVKIKLKGQNFIDEYKADFHLNK